MLSPTLRRPTGGLRSFSALYQNTTDQNVRRISSVGCISARKHRSGKRDSDQARAKQDKTGHGHGEETVRREFFTHGTPTYRSGNPIVMGVKPMWVRNPPIPLNSHLCEAAARFLRHFRHLLVALGAIYGDGCGDEKTESLCGYAYSGKSRGNNARSPQRRSSRRAAGNASRGRLVGDSRRTGIW